MVGGYWVGLAFCLTYLYYSLNLMKNITTVFRWAAIIGILILVPKEVKATWCVAGNSSQGSITPTTTSATTGTVNPSAKVPYWSFTGTAGVCYYFSLCGSSNTEDAVLNVYNGATPSGNLVAANDQGGCANLSALTFVCPANGTYYIAANKYPNSAFSTSTSLKLTHYICGSVTPAATPISDNWTGISMTTPCTSWMAQGAGGEGDWIINSGSFAYGANLACGSGNEAVLAGDQYNLYGVGITKSPNLISYPINTNGTTSMAYSFKHTLQINGDNGISGSNTITLQLQSSNDLVNWTTAWSGSYTVGSSASYGVNCGTVNATINTSTNITTWLRFVYTGIVGKIAYWAIDNGASGTIILPVELQNLAVKLVEGNIKVNWSTASENNNHYFTIERSANGVDFTPLGNVMGAGYSSELVNYEFVDNSPSPGVNYYRIRQTDRDGKYTYSSIVSASYLKTDRWLGDIYPNPADNEINFEVHAEGDDMARVEILDMTGRVVYNATELVKKGAQAITVPLNDIAKGAYSLQVSLENGGYKSAKRLLKN